MSAAATPDLPPLAHLEAEARRLTAAVMADFLGAWRTHELGRFSRWFGAQGRFLDTPFTPAKVGPEAVDAYMRMVRTQADFEGSYEVLDAGARSGIASWRVAYRVLPKAQWPNDLSSGPEWRSFEALGFDLAHGNRVEQAGLSFIRFDDENHVAEFREAWQSELGPAEPAPAGQDRLFEPVALGAMRLDNRAVMAPLTRARSGRERRPGAIAVTYYRERAGAGLIVTEGTNISETSVGYADTPGIWREDQVEAWAQVTRAVHEAGGRIVCQLWHVGRRSHPSLLPDGLLPVAPSAIAADDLAYTYDGFQPMVAPRALAADEIAGIVADYATAAKNARHAGFDGVELHAANGYLIDQFLRSGANARADRYGGSVENRLRFLLEVVGAVSAEIGAARVGVRLSPLFNRGGIYDADPRALFTAAARALGKCGLAYLHVFEEASPPADGQVRVAPDELFAAMRTVFGGAYIANAGYDRERAERAIADGRAEAVAFGRPFLANPDFIARLRERAPLAPELPKDLWYGGGARGYAEPLLRSEGG